MRILYILLVIILLSSCEKEEVIIPRQVYPIEGVYDGVIYMKGNDFSYNANVKSKIQITSFNGEEISIDHHFGTYKGYFQGMRYTAYMEMTDQSDCGLYVSLQIEISGIVRGDSLIENGSFVLYHNSKPYSGVYRVRAKKVL